VAIDAAQVSRDPAVVAAYRSDPLVYQGRITARLGAELRARALGFPPQLAGLTVPLLVQHGTADELVPVIGSRELFGTIGSADKTLREYGGLRHEIYNEPERGGVLDDLVAWLHDHTGTP
jgi:alpha-beta hydrolase superfamily lysophospholipase